MMLLNIIAKYLSMLKGEFYCAIIQLNIFYDGECWDLNMDNKRGENGSRKYYNVIMVL